MAALVVLGFLLLAAGVQNFMIIDAITVGLGAGIFLHGELMRGHQSLSGEIGHMTVNPIDGPPCNCGCFEAMVSANRLRQLAGQGDALCGRLIDDVARWFAVSLGNIILTNDPELIIIQGRYIKAGECFLRRVREGLRRIGLPDVEKNGAHRVFDPGRGTGVIGGAGFVISDFFARRLSFKEKK